MRVRGKLEAVFGDQDCENNSKGSKSAEATELIASDENLRVVCGNKDARLRPERRGRGFADQ